MNFKKIKTDVKNLVSYHISQHEFIKPSYEEICKIRLVNERGTHENSFLGLWSSSCPSNYKKENSIVYEIKYANLVNIKYIGIRDFYTWCMLSDGDINYFINAREKYISDGIDVIIVLDRYEDNTFTLAEIITLNFDKISSFKKIDFNINNFKYIVEE